MTDEELKQLAEKVSEGKASKEETLVFVKEFNRILEELKTELKNN